MEKSFKSLVKPEEDIFTQEAIMKDSSSPGKNGENNDVQENTPNEVAAPEKVDASPANAQDTSNDTPVPEAPAQEPQLKKQEKTTVQEKPEVVNEPVPEQEQVEEKSKEKVLDDKASDQPGVKENTPEKGAASDKEGAAPAETNDSSNAPAPKEPAHEPQPEAETAEPTYLDSNQLSPDTIIEYKEKRTVYKIKNYLSSGSFANTYLAVNPEEDIVVLKEFCPEDAKRKSNGAIDLSTIDIDMNVLNAALEKFKKEPTRVKTLFQNANYTKSEKEKLNLILPRTDFFMYMGNYYYVMEKAEGITLFDYMKSFNENELRNPDVILRIMEQLAIGVCNIRQIPCVHQDLSPGNVIFEMDDQGDIHLKIIDFGLATNLDKLKEDILTGNKKFGSFLGGGTKGFTDIFYNEDLYAANPDKLDLIDVYSLGAILYFMMFFRLSHIWNKDMQKTLEIEIKSMHKYENANKIPYPLKEEDSVGVKQTKLILNECYNLVKDATAYTVKDFSTRIQSAREFLQRIRKMLYRIHWIHTENTEVEAHKQKTSLMFHTTGPWQAAIMDGDDSENSWISLEGRDAGTDTGDIMLRFKLEPNTTPEPRAVIVGVQTGIMPIFTPIIQLGVPTVKPDIHFPQGTGPKTSFGYSGGEGEVTVIANRDWKAHVSSEGYGWLDVVEKEGKAGERVTHFKVSPNNSDKPRKACLVYTCEDQTIEWTVAQGRKETAKIEFESGTITQHTFPSAGGKTDFKFEANYESTVVLNPADADKWLQTNFPKFEKGTRTVVITATPNPDTVEKTATVEIHCEGKSIKFQVKQEKSIPVTGPTPGAGVHAGGTPTPPSVNKITPKSSLNLKFEGDATASQGIAFSCNKDWKVEVMGMTAWVKVAATQGKAGDVQFGVSVDKNTTGSARTATLRVSAGTAHQLYTISQETVDFMQFPATQQSFHCSGGNNMIRFECSNNWKLTIPAHSSTWLIANAVMGSAGVNNISLSVTPNDSTTPRTADLWISCGKSNVLCHVKQEGKPLPPPPPPIPTKTSYMKYVWMVLGVIAIGAIAWYMSSGGTGTKEYALSFPNGQAITIPHQGVENLTHELTANGLWKAEIAEQEPEGWLTIDKASGDESMKNFLYSAGANPKYTPRKATIKVSCGDISKLVRVTQGIDRPDSLERDMEGIMRDMSKIVPFIKSVNRTFTIYERDKATGEKTPVRESIDEILRKMKPGMVIGQTHDIVEFEEDPSTGKIKSITLQKMY